MSEAKVDVEGLRARRDGAKLVDGVSWTMLTSANRSKPAKVHEKANFFWKDQFRGGCSASQRAQAGSRTGNNAYRSEFREVRHRVRYSMTL